MLRIRLTPKTAQPLYALVQILYWLAFGLMFSFASAFLQEKGFSNGAIGLVLGCSYGISAVLQPAIAALLRRLGVPPEKGLGTLYALAALFSALLLLAPLPGAGDAVVFTALLSLYWALQPLVNSLARRWSDAGCPVEFSTARSVASLVFACNIAGMGWLLGKITPLLLPAFYFTVVSLSACFLLLLEPTRNASQPSGASQQQSAKSGRSIPAGFPLLLMGIACLSLAHMLVDNFMLQILQALGGGIQNLGMALSMATFAEVPAIWLYGRLRRRFDDRALLVFAAWAWALKTFLIFLAKSPAAICAAQLLQFCGFGFYTPAIVCCVDRWFPPESRLRGQSLVGSAYTVGCVLAAAAGGTLLDALGASFTLLIISAIACAGAALVSVAVKKANMPRILRGPSL